MEDHNLSFEPMDIDLSGQSVKAMDISDVSHNDSNDQVLNKLCSPKREIRISKPLPHNLSLIRGSPKEREVIKSEPMPHDLSLIRGSPIIMRKTIKSEPLPHDLSLVRDSPVRNQAVIKKFHLNREKPSKKSEGITIQIITILIIGLIALFISSIYNIKCYDDINLEVLSETLSNKLFGQSEAIKIIIKTLELEERSKILIFSGGTGVGKTFASSILLETLGTCSNVYHYTMPSFVNLFTTDFMVGLTMCKKSLVILDDLTVDDIHIKKQIKELVDKSQQLEKDITVILIFNCYEATTDFIKKCDESFQTKLLDHFADVKAIKRFVNFEALNVSHLKECIKQEVQGRTLSDEELYEIIKNFDVAGDGCKGVHSKMKYLNVV